MIKKISVAAVCLLLIANTANAQTHTVVKGDTLWKISKVYNVDVNAIKSANTHIKNFELIYPGDLVNIPEINEGVSDYESEVIRLVNEIRKQNGLKELKGDIQLSKVARLKSEDMKKNNYFSHTSPTYGSPFDMMKRFGISYKSAGENIAKGQKTPQAVVNAWMNSAGHRENILKASYTHIGVGYVANGNYWTQMFISK